MDAWTARLFAVDLDEPHVDAHVRRGGQREVAVRQLAHARTRACVEGGRHWIPIE